MSYVVCLIQCKVDLPRSSSPGFCQGYITHGGGFSHCQTGASVAHANDLPAGQYKNIKNKVLKNTDFQARLKKEALCAKVVVDAITHANKRLAELSQQKQDAQKNVRDSEEQRLNEDEQAQTKAQT